MRKSTKNSRGRSFGGCLTCRRRKVKCDEARPGCNQCSRSSLACGGYEAKIRFVHYAPDGRRPPNDAEQNDRGHSRRILFTESEQAAMSKRMQETITEREVDDLLKQLGTDSYRLGEDTPTAPFSFFRTSGLTNSCQTAPSPAIPHVSTTPGPEDCADSCPDSRTEPQIVVNSDGYLENWQTSGHMFHGDTLDSSLVDAVSILSPLVAQEAISSPRYLHMSDVTNNNLQVSVSTHAHFLLDHYKSQMGRLFSPLRVRKPPWSILHFPRALSALSELSIFKKATHAHTSLFYSILAVSAFNWYNVQVDKSGNTTYWRHVGEVFHHQAKRELEQTCETELMERKTSKYKDALMAILTMVTISVVTGQQEEARSFLLNAEMLICHRGILKANKSRKLKLLHSIYLFLRVIEESTYVYPPDKHRTIAPSQSLNLMHFPSLRTHNMCLGRDLDDICGVNFEVGLFSGQAADQEKDEKVFGEIYGFPQKLLSFISQATHLANEIAFLRSTTPGTSMTSELEAHSKSLEDEICAWSHNGSVVESDTEDPASVFANRVIMSHFVEAIHSAVIIFFYRRVRQTNPLLLQTHVEQTISSLELFEREQKNFSLVNCGIVWPGFIAGAEALDSNCQARLHRLLTDCARTSGMRNFESAAEFLKVLWESRSQQGNRLMTWMDLVRRQQTALILT